MAQSETVERILDVAQQLFAEHGFAETSLRAITAQAGVNLAAVNYHFGSKDALIQVIFDRFLAPFCRRLEVELQRLDGSQPSLEEWLDMLVREAFAVAREIGCELTVFMRLFGMAVRQNRRELRIHLARAHGRVLRRYLQRLHESIPQVAPLELFWRVNFMLGAATFGLAGIQPLRDIAQSDFGVETSAEQVLQLMVPFMAAGMRAAPALGGEQRAAGRRGERSRAARPDE